MKRHRTRWSKAGVLVGSALAACGFAPGCDSGSGESDPSETCVSTRQLFAEQVWPVLNAQCTGCHAPGGMAATGDNPKQRTAGFVLEWDAYPDFLDENLAQVSRMVTEQIDGVPKLLVKITGGDTHVGGAPVKKDSAEYQLFAQLTTQIQNGQAECGGAKTSAFEGVPLDDWAPTFRRAAILLGGRLPTDAEKKIADEAAFDAALDKLLGEPAFLTHVKETWNDVLLTDGGDQVQVGPFQFRLEDFPGMQTWQLGADAACSGAADYDKCVFDFYIYWSTVENAFLAEPLELIAHVVEKGAPFSEILTADYAMVNPYSAIAYNAENQFSAPSKDTFSEWKEVHVAGQERGPVPHAGVLTTPAFLGRWVSTETNKNRARSRMVYKAFLATDVLKLAQRPVDTAALTGIANPTRNAAACDVCHNLIDPIATSFTNYSDTAAFDYDPAITAATNPHQEMLPPGFGTELLPGQESKMLPALVKLLAQDKRFSLSVARVAYKGLLGREPLRYPKDPSDPAFKDQFHAWDEQDQFLHTVSEAYVSSGESYKEVVRAILKSPFFRAKDTTQMNPALAVEVGAGRLLTPEMLDRKIEAVAGIPWSTGGWLPHGDRIRDLRSRYQIFYGGIDSLAVTSRLVEANPLIANVSERMANEVACRTVAWEFTLPAADRELLPGVEIDTLPDGGEGPIRDAIVRLFERVLGEARTADDPEVEAAYALFRDTQAELAAAGDAYYLPYECLGLFERTAAATYPCGEVGMPGYLAECYDYDALLPDDRKIDHDEHFTIGAWMAVVSYLFGDVHFLYE